MDYLAISKVTIGQLYKAYKSFNDSPLSQQIRKLIELRVSQLNGCDYCCKVHADEAKKANVAQEKIDALSAWSSSAHFSEKEKVALMWCERVTSAQAGNSEEKKRLQEHLSEREIVDLTACSAIMNALNRLAITLREF